MTTLELYTDQIVRGAKESGQRTGQYLFNHLEPGPANVIAGSLFDPFHQDLSNREISDWLDNHLIFDGNKVIAVFKNNQILWEET